MFDIGPLEFLTIALVALVVFGPERLPDIARRVGGYLREVRKAAAELTAGLDAEVRVLAEPIKDLKEDLTQPLKDVKESLDDTARQVQKPLAETQDALRSSIADTKKSVQDVSKAATEGVSTGDTVPVDGDAESVDTPTEGLSAASEPATATTAPAPDEEAGQGGSAASVASLGSVRWVGDEPTTGVSPGDAEAGLDDPVPASLQDGEVLDTMRDATQDLSGQDESEASSE